MTATTVNFAPEVLVSKSLAGSSIVDATDNTKQLVFDLSGATSGQTATLLVPHTTARTYTFPDATDTVVLASATQSLANKTLTNCTLNSNTNSIAASALLSATTTISISGATAPVAGQVLTATSGVAANWQTPAGNVNDANNYVFNNADNTKRQAWSLGGATAGTSTTFIFAQTTNRNITFPDATDTVVLLAAAQTLTNKTLTAPVITTISNGGVITIPSGTDTLVARTTTDTLQNKSLVNANSRFVDGTDATKRLAFQTSGATTGTTLTLAGIQTVNRTVTFPDATDTVLVAAATQTVSGKTLDSAANTITITSAPLAAANVNTLLNQALLTTSSPTFNNFSTTGTQLSYFGGTMVRNYATATVTSATLVTLLTITLATGASAVVNVVVVVYNTTDSNGAFFEVMSRIINTAGTVSVAGNIVNRLNRDSPGFNTSGITLTPSGGTLLVQYGGNAGRSHTVRAFITTNRT